MPRFQQFVSERKRIPRVLLPVQSWVRLAPMTMTYASEAVGADAGNRGALPLTRRPWIAPLNFMFGMMMLTRCR
jgi:hypothetical protein